MGLRGHRNVLGRWYINCSCEYDEMGEHLMQEAVAPPSPSISHVGIIHKCLFAEQYSMHPLR